MWRRRQRDEHVGLSRVTREALDILRPVPDPDPEAWQEDRRAFLAEARRLSQEMRRSDTEMVNDGSGGRIVPPFHKLWQRRPKMMLARILIAAAVFLGTAVGSTQAAQASLPGSALYPLKMQMEKLLMAGAQRPQTRLSRGMDLAEARVDEVGRLSERGDDVPSEVAERYAEILARAVAAANDLEGEEGTEARAGLAEWLRQHVATLRDLLGEEGELTDETLERMIAAAEQAASALESGDDNGDDDSDKLADPDETGEDDLEADPDDDDDDD